MTSKYAQSLMLGVLIAASLHAKAAIVVEDYAYNQTSILALTLARSGNIIPETDMAEVIASLQQNKTVPRRYRAQFESLMRTAQMILEIKTNSTYNPVGYEFETGHGSKDSLDTFAKGAEHVAKAVQETFGTQGQGQISSVVKEGDNMETFDINDDSGAKWSIVQEYVRDESASTAPTGWETVSPPMFNRDYLRYLASFVLRLGDNPYGREAEFTGAHQTYDLLPQGVAFEAGLAGRTVVNYILLMEQFSPVIFKRLQVERYGGYKNFFIRPLVFDHTALLNEMSATNPQDLTIQRVERLMNDKYAIAEYDTFVKNTVYFTDKDRAEMLAESVKRKKSFPKLWKYHDLRIHFNPENPARTLVETRIGDYRQGSPEDILRVTFLNQMMLKLAFEMAKNNQVWKFEVPARLQGDSDDDYWKKLQSAPASSEKKFFAALQLDKTAQDLLKAGDFEPRSPKFKVAGKPSFGYEMEFIGSEFLDLAVPTDPKARSHWREMGHGQRVEYFIGLIADPEQRERFLNEEYVEYTPDIRRIITTEFQADIMKIPHLDPSLWQEDSGNFEIKSNGRDIFDLSTLVDKVHIVDKKLMTTSYGMHAHLFIPSQIIKAFRDRPELADQAGAFIERVSLLMQLEDYREGDGEQASLDSWSLDRYSPKDLAQVVSWLKGQGKLGNIDQKYHNIGVREVVGGVDIELRAVGQDIAYMQELMNYVSKAFIERDFGIDHLLGASRPLFHDFTSLDNPVDGTDFTLVHALSQHYALTKQQIDLVQKFQFEIYKPSMADYVFFEDFMAANSVDPSKMDTRFVRSNFESNVALPILNYNEQPYLSQKPIKDVSKAREKFLERVYELVLATEKNANAKFILKEANFLHLAKWLKRSTHASRPDFNKVDEATAKKQRKILKNLVTELRGYVVDFTKDTELPSMLRASLDSSKARFAIDARFENELKEKSAKTPKVSQNTAPEKSNKAKTCSALFNGKK